MSTREPPVLTPRLLRDVSEYLDNLASDLESCHWSPRVNGIEPAEVAQEVKRVKRWASKLRIAALWQVAP